MDREASSSAHIGELLRRMVHHRQHRHDVRPARCRLPPPTKLDGLCVPHLPRRVRLHHAIPSRCRTAIREVVEGYKHGVRADAVRSVIRQARLRHYTKRVVYCWFVAHSRLGDICRNAQGRSEEG